MNNRTWGIWTSLPSFLPSRQKFIFCFCVVESEKNNFCLNNKMASFERDRRSEGGCKKRKWDSFLKKEWRSTNTFTRYFFPPKRDARRRLFHITKSQNNWKHKTTFDQKFRPQILAKNRLLNFAHNLLTHTNLFRRFWRRRQLPPLIGHSAH